jgi:hypothetical protein
VLLIRYCDVVDGIGLRRYLWDGIPTLMRWTCGQLELFWRVILYVLLYSICNYEFYLELINRKPLFPGSDTVQQLELICQSLGKVSVALIFHTI